MQELKRNKVTDVVRVCDPTYNAEVLQRAGITVHVCGEYSSRTFLSAHTLPRRLSWSNSCMNRVFCRASVSSLRWCGVICALSSAKRRDAVRILRMLLLYLSVLSRTRVFPLRRGCSAEFYDLKARPRSLLAGDSSASHARKLTYRAPLLTDASRSPAIAQSRTFG